MATDSAAQFVLDAIDLDGVDVGRDDEDGNVFAARDLSDTTTELDDVLELGHEHGLRARNVQTDMPAAETRIVFEEEQR